MNFVKSALFAAVSILFISGCESQQLCVKNNNQIICPSPDSKLYEVLSSFRYIKLTDNSETKVDYSQQLSAGKYMKLDVVPHFDGYMNIIALNHNGKKTQVFPNKFEPDSYVEKGKRVALYNDKYKLQAVPPLGLGYFVVVITQERVLFDTYTKSGTFDAFSDEKMFKSILEDIKSGKYGDHYLNLLAYYTH